MLCGFQPHVAAMANLATKTDLSMIQVGFLGTMARYESSSLTWPMSRWEPRRAGWD